MKAFYTKVNVNKINYTEGNMNVILKDIAIKTDKGIKMLCEKAVELLTQKILNKSLSFRCNMVEPKLIIKKRTCNIQIKNKNRAIKCIFFKVTIKKAKIVI
ncbi:hypothetical protein KPL37_17745 [Clostridium frigoris]|uniref:Uncharacterized protein n=1 Tax=Clostridium frigoris TaxID=205327 RepID=A0ABS6BY81_9CLOT|nr:hypothetical protein [Clostridium frigoris]MBU3161553.1 hypothetical protein [Clostridium frigoris]